MTTEAEKLIAKIIDDAEEIVAPVDNGAPPSMPKGKVSQVDCLIELAAKAELFHTPDNEAFADIKVDGHRETWAVKSEGFNNWLRHDYYDVTGGAPNQNAMAEACRTIAAKAQYDSPTRTVHIRVAEFGGRLYLDLGNHLGQVVEIDLLGWRLVPDPPVRFRRTTGMRALRVPMPGGLIDALRPFLNVDSDADFVLVVSWILAALRSCGPYPVMIVAGEQGTAKSTFSAMIRELVDPNGAPLRTVPRSERDIFIAACNGHVLAFDNVSHLSVGTSDTLCQLATGGGFATRALYTDGEEKLFNASRPSILNGIVDFVERPDLAERSVFLKLMPISEEMRRPKEELDAAFAEACPQILGALLNAMVEGLKRLPEVRLERYPRMADFAKWATACETAFRPSGTFMAAYEQNRKGAVEQVLDVDPVADAVRILISHNGQWHGTASQLLAAVSEIVGDRTAKSRSWPSTAQGLSGRLARATSVLRSVGIDVTTAREGKDRTRMIHITKAPDKVVRPTSDPRFAVMDAGCFEATAGGLRRDVANDSGLAADDQVAGSHVGRPTNPLVSKGETENADEADEADDLIQAVL